MHLHAASQLTTAPGSSNCRRPPAGSQTIQNSRHFARHTVLVLQPWPPMRSLGMAFRAGEMPDLRSPESDLSVPQLDTSSLWPG